MASFKAGDTSCIVESNSFTREGVIAYCEGGIYLFKYLGERHQSKGEPYLEQFTSF